MAGGPPRRGPCSHIDSRAQKLSQLRQIGRAIKRAIVMRCFQSAVIQRGLYGVRRNIQRLRQIQHALRALVLHQHAIHIQQQQVDPHRPSMPLR